MADTFAMQLFQDPSVFWIGIGALVAMGALAAPVWTADELRWLLGVATRLAAVAARAFRAPLESVAARAGALGGRLRGSAAHASLGEASEMIDIVRLGLSAGLSFDASLELYCSGRETPLASCMSRAMLSWRIGLATREEALLGVASEMGLRALESFATVSAQAIELGAPLAQTLAGQSAEMRSAHRAAVEREIERVPVKLLIPTGTLILPALLLSIIGPLLAASGMV